MTLFWMYSIKYSENNLSLFKVALRKPGLGVPGSAHEHTVTCRLLWGSRASRTPDMSNNLTCRLSCGRAMIFWPTHTLILQSRNKVGYI